MAKWYSVVGLFLFFISCKRNNDPTQNIGNPVFIISGTANTQNIELTAGLNNYYMYTNFTKGSFEVQLLEGSLAQQNCVTCEPTLGISIRNYSINPPFNPDSIAAVGSYYFYKKDVPIETIYQLNLTSTAFGIGIPFYNWSSSLVSFSTDQQPTKKFDRDGIYDISQTVNYVNGCTSTLTQPIHINANRIGQNTNFNVNYIDTFTVLFNSIPIDNSATVTWDFGDSQTAQGSIVSHTFANTGLYKVCVQVIKGLDTSNYCKNVNTLDYTVCKANYTFNTALTIDSFQFNKITITWKDKDGIIYSSANTVQDEQSYFRIIESKKFTPNANGNNTKIITVLFNCTVVSEDKTKTINLTNMRGTFGIAYPQ